MELKIEKTYSANGVIGAVYVYEGRRCSTLLGKGVVDVQAALTQALGLKKDPVSLIEAAFGGSRWTKYGYDRVYIDDVYSLIGLEVTRYGTGNVSSASLKGERISNNQAKKIVYALDYGKVWYDVPTGQVMTKNIPSEWADEIIEAVQEVV